ncbi:hypothetical protein ILYODFUR_032763 [Ilyodon furcidens]|uniref:Uncharacterized protein n=1 Tax=Ilyodon furcidens TaxID=33524 RepID=A0ABV0TZP5_9TELE
MLTSSGRLWSFTIQTAASFLSASPVPHPAHFRTSESHFISSGWAVVQIIIPVNHFIHKKHYIYDILADTINAGSFAVDRSFEVEDFSLPSSSEVKKGFMEPSRPEPSQFELPTQ